MAIHLNLLVLIIVVTELWRLYLIWRRWHSFSKHPPEILQPFIYDDDYERLHVDVVKECSSMAADAVLRLTIKLVKLLSGYHLFVWNATSMFSDDDMSRAAWFIALDVLITSSLEKPFEKLGFLFLAPEELHFVSTHLGQLLADVGAATIMAGLAAHSAVFVVERFGALRLLFPAILVQFSGIILFTINLSIWLPLIARPLADIYATERKISELARRVGFPERRILVDVTRGRPPSTYYLGWFGRFFLAINFELTLAVPAEQAVAFVARELGRWKYNHSLYRLMITLGEIIIFSILSTVTYYKPWTDKLFGFAHGKHPPPLIRSYLAINFIWPVLLELFKGPLNIFMAHCEYEADKWACHKGYSESLKAGLLNRDVHDETPEFDELYFMWFYGQPTIIQRARKISTIRHLVDSTSHGGDSGVSDPSQSH